MGDGGRQCRLVVVVAFDDNVGARGSVLATPAHLVNVRNRGGKWAVARHRSERGRHDGAQAAADEQLVFQPDVGKASAVDPDQVAATHPTCKRFDRVNLKLVKDLGNHCFRRELGLPDSVDHHERIVMPRLHVRSGALNVCVVCVDHCAVRAADADLDAAVVERKVRADDEDRVACDSFVAGMGGRDLSDLWGDLRIVDERAVWRGCVLWVVVAALLA